LEQRVGSGSVRERRAVVGYHASTGCSASSRGGVRPSGGALLAVVPRTAAPPWRGAAELKPPLPSERRERLRHTLATKDVSIDQLSIASSSSPFQFRGEFFGSWRVTHTADPYVHT